MCSVWGMLQHPSHRTHSLRRRTPDLQPTTTLGQYSTWLQLVLRSCRRANDCPKHVELIQRSIKLLLLHLFGHLNYSPTVTFSSLAEPFSQMRPKLQEYNGFFCPSWTVPYISKDKLFAYSSKINWPEDGNSCCNVLSTIWTRLKWSLSPLAYIAQHTSLRSDEPYGLYLLAISERNYNTQVDKLLRNNVGHFGQCPAYKVYILITRSFWTSLPEIS